MNPNNFPTNKWGCGTKHRLNGPYITPVTWKKLLTNSMPPLGLEALYIVVEGLT